MRFRAFLVAGILGFWTAGASAGPLVHSGDVPTLQQGELLEVHHKPGHGGGPPWMRRGQSRSGASGTYTERRTVCRTTYRTYYDDYTGDYVRRSVRVCD